MDITKASKVKLVSAATLNYVTTDGNSLVATGTAQSAVTFNVAVQPGGYSLQNAANSFFTCAENGGTSPLVANRVSASTWETFAFAAQSGSFSFLFYTFLLLISPPFILSLVSYSYFIEFRKHVCDHCTSQQPSRHRTRLQLADSKRGNWQCVLRLFPVLCCCCLIEYSILACIICALTTMVCFSSLFSKKKKFRPHSGSNPQLSNITCIECIQA